MESVNDFLIADLDVRIIFKDGEINNIGLLRSFEPFRTNNPNGSRPILQMTVDDTLVPKAKEERQRVKRFETGNGDTIVDRLSDGGYQFIIRDMGGNDRALMQINGRFDEAWCALRGNAVQRSFGLNSAMMSAFAFAARYKQAALIHAAAVCKDGYGYAFIAASGTGKSTHADMWLKTVPGCQLLNDDNPVLRFIDDTPYIYGSPWSGKTTCYRQHKMRLGAIARINRASENSIEKVNGLMAFGALLPSFTTMRWETSFFNDICDIITQVVKAGNIYVMHCLPDENAATVCSKAILR